MASSTPMKNKDGKTYAYRIKVFRGRDGSGKQLKPFQMIWHIPEGMTHPRTIKKELEKVKAQFESECESGNISLKHPTYEKYSAYVLEIKERDCKRTTVARYKTINERVTAELGNIKIDDITAEHLNRFYQRLGRDGENKKTGKGLSAKTIREHHNLISTILDQALKEGIVRYNVAKAAIPPKVRRSEAEYFEPEEVFKIMDCLGKESLNWQALIMLLIATGARRGEIAGLRWKYVDFDNCKITISGNILYLPDVGTYEDTPKSGKSRVVPVDPSVMELLKRHKGEQLKLRFRLGKEWKGEKDFENSYCFTQRDGKPINPDSVTKYLSRFSEKYDLPHINPHKFRHTLASVLISEGVDLITAANWLGHAQASTTTNIYGHVMSKANKAAANTVSRVLFTKDREDKEKNA